MYESSGRARPFAPLLPRAGGRRRDSIGPHGRAPRARPHGRAPTSHPRRRRGTRRLKLGGPACRGRPSPGARRGAGAPKGRPPAPVRLVAGPPGPLLPWPGIGTPVHNKGAGRQPPHSQKHPREPHLDRTERPPPPPPEPRQCSCPSSGPRRLRPGRRPRARRRVDTSREPLKTGGGRPGQKVLKTPKGRRRVGPGAADRPTPLPRTTTGGAGVEGRVRNPARGARGRGERQRIL